MSTKFSVFLLFLALVGATFFTTGPVEAKAYTWMNAISDTDKPVNLKSQGHVNRMQNVTIKAMNCEIETLQIMAINCKQDVDMIQTDVSDLRNKVIGTATAMNTVGGQLPLIWVLLAMVFLAVVWLFFKAYDVVGPKRAIAQPAATTGGEEALPAMGGVPPDTGDEPPSQEDPPKKKKGSKSSN